MPNRLILVAALALACAGVVSPARGQETLTVWWYKGYYRSEDDAIREIVRKYESTNKKVRVELSLLAPQDMMAKTVAALDAGRPPDVVFGPNFDAQAIGKWAYEGRLEDVSAVVDPARARFTPGALETAFLYSDRTKSRSYYALPILQSTMHIHYWVDMLADAGFAEADIPKTWKEYWSFWCDKVQPALRRRNGARLFAVGQPMGVESSDSMSSFLMFADAYNVQMVSDSGKLTVDDPSVRSGLISAMRDYVEIHSKGCTPPSSINWKDPENNLAFHNRTTVMTHNGTISVPGKWADDASNATLSPEQRAIARLNYEHRIRTTGLPAKPDGTAAKYRTQVRQVVVFADAPNKPRAKEFAAFLIQEENLTPLVEGLLGRGFPVTRAAQERPFWKSDPHRHAVYLQYKQGMIPFEYVRNHRFTTVNLENVWAKAMSRIVNDKWAVEAAVDEMIARIKALVLP